MNSRAVLYWQAEQHLLYFLPLGPFYHGTKPYLPKLHVRKLTFSAFSAASSSQMT